jgi:indole-3-glycerol phosphate synthase
MPKFLDEMVERARMGAERDRSQGVLLGKARPGGPPRSLRQALESALEAGRAPVIAEVKRASPSRGRLIPEGTCVGPAGAAELAATYERAGASAISVLTEPAYFKGSPADLTAVRERVGVPVLRKDFVLDPWQVLESWAMGADAVLLIVRLLRFDEIIELARFASSLGLEALVEIHSADELTIAREVHKRSGALVGVNARDLDTLTVDPQVQEVLLAALPEGCVPVAESGLREPADVRRLHLSGARAFLVGEALVTSGDPAGQLEALVGALRTARAKA